MKKTILYTVLMAGLFSSCDLNINEDPNYPGNTQVTADLIFPAFEGGVASAVGGDIHNYAGFFAQYYEQKPEANQYNTLCDYTFNEASQIMDYSYRILYAGALMDSKEVLDKSKNEAEIYATHVLRAYALQVMVDNTSEAPYSEALQGNAVLNPKWDKGEDVYKGVMKAMDDAEKQLTERSAIESKDLIFSGNLEQWKGFANALRLRMAMRFIDAGVESETYTTLAKKLVSENNFFTGDAGFSGFADEADKRNPWYTTNAVSLGGNHCGAYPIISYLTATNDPRISYAFDVNAKDNKYVGQIPGGKVKSGSDWKNANVSSVNAKHSDLKGATQPVYFFTQAELQFLIAEVELRFNNNEGAAKSAYEKAVKADFAARSMSGQEANILNLWAGASNKLELIYMQKWVAFFCMNHMEAWSEIRRTDCPKLSNVDAEQVFQNGIQSGYKSGDLISPWVNGLPGGGLIKRMCYPQSARMYNSNTPKAVPGNTPVWWDKN